MEFKDYEPCQENNGVQLWTPSFLLWIDILWQILILQHFNVFHMKLLVRGLMIGLELPVIHYHADQKVTYKYISVAGTTINTTTVCCTCALLLNIGKICWQGSNAEV